MKQIRILMGMPITVEIVDPQASAAIFDEVYEYFAHIDEKFSTYKTTSEISAINGGKLTLEDASPEMQMVFLMCEETKRETGGYFDIKTPRGDYDPSGLVKGWSIWNAAQLLKKRGFENYYIDAGGDIQPHGHNVEGDAWAIGIKNPFNETENVKVVYASNEGVATSGTYIRGLHIYNPHGNNQPVNDIVSLTVIGPNIHDADRYATAAFAMGAVGIKFIESLNGFEGYMIDKNKVATMTTGFEKYTNKNMLNIIDRFLNKITMYRLVFYYLIALVAIAAIFGAVGILPYSPLSIGFSFFFVTAVAAIANGLFAWLFNAHPNTESVYITAFILALIITPGHDAATMIFLAWAAVLAMASKYFLALNKKHIFNPTAIAVVITAFAFNEHASWWIGGNVPMMAFVVIGGLLVLRKIQRFDLALTFFGVALLSDILTHTSSSPLVTIEKALLHTPLIFFASIMITEPLTTPPTRKWRLIYGAIVGALFSPFIHIGSIYSTPELALVVGNIFSYAVSPKEKRMLKLKERQQLTPDIYDFVFETDKKMKFQPGQYLEWTLSHDKTDLRGNRRYFTIASSPTEDNIRLGVKFYEPSSTFKTRLLELKPGDTIMAGQLAGDFTLPHDTSKKLAFIAGGIGITPFRSMVKDLSDRGEKRDAILLYSSRRKEDVAYREIFDEAQQKIGMRTIYILTAESRVTAETIKKDIPDYHERMFYISGTQSMTHHFKEVLSVSASIARTSR